MACFLLRISQSRDDVCDKWNCLKPSDSAACGERLYFRLLPETKFDVGQRQDWMTVVQLFNAVRLSCLQWPQVFDPSWSEDDRQSENHSHCHRLNELVIK
jgi:hypothetical protein